MSSSLSIFKIITEGRAASRFLIAALLSFAFSIAVILSTIGLMDGFEGALRDSLRKSSGDFKITSSRGFFLVDEIADDIKDFRFTPIMEVEAFAVANEKNKGVLVKGIQKDSFASITSLDVKNLDGGVAIGEELAKALSLEIGDDLVLTFASDQIKDQGGAILKKFQVSSIIKHGIYEKDLRFVYTDLSNLTETFGYKKGAVNKLLLSAKNDLGLDASIDEINSRLAQKFNAEPFWAEYKTLLKAVEVEKTSISLVLQIIVVVAIFNVIAFIIFISEKKSQEFFLLRAFGVSLKQIVKFWRALLFGMWMASALLSVALTYIFNIVLQKLPIFQLPGDIYVLSNLKLKLGLEDFALVFSLALVWIMLIGALTMWRMKKRAVLSGLREEFK